MVQNYKKGETHEAVRYATEKKLQKNFNNST